MAISITNVGTAGTAVGATLVLAVPAGGIPAGATIFVAVDENSTTIGGSVTDGANTYLSTAGAFNNGSSLNGFGRLFYAENVIARTSSDSITYTRQTLAAAAAFSCIYVTGLATSSSIDSAVTNVATGTGTTPSVTSGTPATAGELFVAFSSTSPALATDNFVQDTGHGWALPPNNTPALALARVAGGTQVNAGTSGIIFAPTWARSSPWTAQVFGFKPLSAIVFRRTLSHLGTRVGSRQVIN